MSETNEKPLEEDLDAFLIGVESKLRGPFSSLDFSKAVTAVTATRSSAPREYLESVLQVLPRMDKVVKLRLMVGLLGLEPSQHNDDVVYEILTRAQEAPLHEEWVRVVAGLCRGILFSEDGRQQSCQGDEAKSIIEKTCNDILARVTDSEKSDDNDEQGGNDSQDTDPLFAPYHFSLLDPQNLQRCLPDCLVNQHFQVNQEADILQLDDRLERAKAQEETVEPSQKKNRAPAVSGQPGASSTNPVELEQVIMPGMKSIKPSSVSKSKSPAAHGKSSMFLQAKKPTAGGRLGGQLGNVRKPAVRPRKAGAAQSLLAKSRRPGAMAKTASARGVGSVGGTAGAGGRAMKYGNSRSKMKVLDIAEVSNLAREHQQRAEAETQEQKLSARKRKIMEAAAAKGLVATSKKRKPNENTEKELSQSTDASTRVAENDGQSTIASNARQGAAPIVSSNPLRTDATTAQPMHQQQPASVAGNVPPASTTTSAPTNHATTEPPAISAPGSTLQDWRQLLEKSNKLSADDRFRAKAFFTDRFNPTPDVPVYKMKLHEEKKVHPQTNETVKETLYLELDYNTFGFKQLRKIKKYD